MAYPQAAWERAMPVQEVERSIVACGIDPHETLRAMECEVQPDTTTGELDDIGAAVLRRHGARSAPRMIYGCPTTNLIVMDSSILTYLFPTSALNARMS